MGSDGNRFETGVCKQSMCTRATPDGAMTYACYRCEIVNEGMGGQSNEGGASAGGETNTAGTVAAAGAPTNPPGGSSAGGAASGSAGAAGSKAVSSGAAATKSTSDDGGGCSVTHVRGGAGALGVVLAALGLAIAGLRRRRTLAS
jgi:hypothetical protein